MAQTGKRLIEDFIEPLLNWWDNTKKSLSAVEALLRLKLPDSQKLRFNAVWSSRLEHLQKISINRDLHQFILILDGLGCSIEFITHRLCLSGLHSVVPSHLLICDAHDDVAKVMNQLIQPEWMYFAPLNCNDTTFDIKKFITLSKLTNINLSLI